MSTSAISPTSTIAAIDVHAHYGVYCNKPNALLNEWMSGEAEVVTKRAAAANTEITVVSPLQALIPRGHGDPVGGNEDAAQVVANNPALRQWVVIDPQEPRTFEQAAAMLQQPQCVGIKIHPEEHRYPIKEYGEVLFRFAAEHDAVVLTHSGEQNSLPEDFVPFCNKYQKVRLILAHLGCGWDGDPSHQVRALQKSRNGNIWIDTSSAMSIMPGIIEWGVAEVGAERLLYGTDTPLYFAPMQRVRIDQANISDSDKRKILRDNAVQLLDLKTAA